METSIRELKARAKKKICAKCGEKKWKRDFYKNSSSYSSYCKDCERELKRIRYRKLYKAQEEITHCNGIKYSNLKFGGIIWTENMLQMLRNLYPYTSNPRCAKIIGVSQRTITRKAKQLGLSKDANFLHEMRVINGHKKHDIPNAGWIKKGQHLSPATEFKKKII